MGACGLPAPRKVWLQTCVETPATMSVCPPGRRPAGKAGRSDVGPPRVVVVDGGAQEVLDAVARLAAGGLDQSRRPTLSWRNKEILAEHRSPAPRVGSEAERRGIAT